MKLQTLALGLLALSACSTCHLATGVVYINSTGYIDNIVWGSPADKAHVPLGGKLISHDDGHLVVLYDGKILTYDLDRVCVEQTEMQRWK